MVTERLFECYAKSRKGKRGKKEIDNFFLFFSLMLLVKIATDKNNGGIT